MAFSISPGVNVTEVDLTTVVPSVSTTTGGFAGYFKWGPANTAMLIDSEVTLAKTFGTPDNNSANSFFTAASFLAYGNSLQTVRVLPSGAYNATSNVSPTAFTVTNPTVFQQSYLYQNNGGSYGPFVARYAGALGNTISVAVIDTCNTNSFATLTLASGVYANAYFTAAPGTSAYANTFGASNDEIHIAVLDAGGLFSGTRNTVLEVFPFVSKASDAMDVNNSRSNYYKQVIFDNSKYIYAIDPVDYANTSNSTITGVTGKVPWGSTVTQAAGAANASFINLGNTVNMTTSYSARLLSGTDGSQTDAELQSGYVNYFSNKETIDISLLIAGAANTGVQSKIVDIAATRGDCVAFISPPKSAVVNNDGLETNSITTWLTSLARSSSYTVADSGWKYMFDAYNNVYRWVPLNGDIAGLCVNTDAVADPWYSPAGFNRGAIKNAIKLAWNPNKAARDLIYAAGVNPVVSFPGQGIILYGDKTLQSKPSAFDRINVRRLFIILEKAIAKSAQYSLFEFNDSYTRDRFVNSVEPFLRDVQGRNGITDFRVVCDTTNNTPAVIDANRFVGDIYVKPARSTNFIQLNFVAVGTGVDFSTIVR